MGQHSSAAQIVWIVQPERGSLKSHTECSFMLVAHKPYFGYSKKTEKDGLEIIALCFAFIASKSFTGLSPCQVNIAFHLLYSWSMRPERTGTKLIGVGEGILEQTEFIC